MRTTARTIANWNRIYAMSFASIYELYIAKVEKKGRTKAEVDQVIRWLTGYTQTALDAHIAKKTTFEDFFAKAAAIPMHQELAHQPYSPLISVMTVDFLLTARDLPGWPGSFPSIDYRHMLRCALKELEDGQFAGERMTRELVILDAIAEHHDLGSFFRKEASKRHKNLRRPLEGNAISPKRLYLDASRLGIENVYDAAFVAHYIHKAAPDFSLATAWQFLTNSFKYRMLSFKKGIPFPASSEWRGPASS